MCASCICIYVHVHVHVYSMYVCVHVFVYVYSIYTSIYMYNTCLQAKVIHIHAKPFSVENGLLTPTFKLCRPLLRRMYSEQVSEMYESLMISQVVTN